MINSLYEIFKKLRHVLENTVSSNFSIKIEASHTLALFAERLLDVADIVIQYYESDILKAIHNASTDRVPKVQQAAQEAKRAWEKLHEKSKFVGPPNTTGEVKSPEKEIKSRLGIQDAPKTAASKRWSKLGQMRQIMKLQKAAAGSGRPSTSVQNSEIAKTNDVISRWQSALHSGKFLKRGMGVGGGFVPLPEINKKGSFHKENSAQNQKKSIKALILEFAMSKGGLATKITNFALDKFGNQIIEKTEICSSNQNNNPADSGMLSKMLGNMKPKKERNTKLEGLVSQLKNLQNQEKPLENPAESKNEQILNTEEKKQDNQENFFEEENMVPDQAIQKIDKNVTAKHSNQNHPETEPKDTLVENEVQNNSPKKANFANGLKALVSQIKNTSEIKQNQNSPEIQPENKSETNNEIKPEIKTDVIQRPENIKISQNKSENQENLIPDQSIACKEIAQNKPENVKNLNKEIIQELKPEIKAESKSEPIKEISLPKPNKQNDNLFSEENSVPDQSMAVRKEPVQHNAEKQELPLKKPQSPQKQNENSIPDQSMSVPKEPIKTTLNKPTNLIREILKETKPETYEKPIENRDTIAPSNFISNKIHETQLNKIEPRETAKFNIQENITQKESEVLNQHKNNIQNPVNFIDKEIEIKQENSKNKEEIVKNEDKIIKNEENIKSNEKIENEIKKEIKQDDIDIDNEDVGDNKEMLIENNNETVERQEIVDENKENVVIENNENLDEKIQENNPKLAKNDEKLIENNEKLNEKIEIIPENKNDNQENLVFQTEKQAEKPVEIKQEKIQKIIENINTAPKLDQKPKIEENKLIKNNENIKKKDREDDKKVYENVQKFDSVIEHLNEQNKLAENIQNNIKEIQNPVAQEIEKDEILENTQPLDNNIIESNENLEKISEVQAEIEQSIPKAIISTTNMTQSNSHIKKESEYQNPYILPLETEQKPNRYDINSKKVNTINIKSVKKPEKITEKLPKEEIKTVKLKKNTTENMQKTEPVNLKPHSLIQTQQNIIKNQDFPPKPLETHNEDILSETVDFQSKTENNLDKTENPLDFSQTLENTVQLDEIPKNTNDSPINYTDPHQNYLNSVKLLKNGNPEKALSNIMKSSIFISVNNEK